MCVIFEFSKSRPNMSNQEPANNGSKPPLFNGSATFRDMFNCCVFRDSVNSRQDRHDVIAPQILNNIDADLPVPEEPLDELPTSSSK